MSSGPVFEPTPPVKEEPYKIVDESNPLYSNSWKNTANKGSAKSMEDSDAYFNRIKKEAKAFKKKAFKNMKPNQGE